MTNDTEVLTLAEFLLARIAEDEALANVDLRAERDGQIHPAWGANAERILAECEAKRQIVEHAAGWAATGRETPEGWTAETCTAYRMAMDWTCRALAAVYAAHPDYREEWRP